MTHWDCRGCVSGKHGPSRAGWAFVAVVVAFDTALILGKAL